MHARVTEITMDPSRVDETVSRLEEEEVPTWKEINGFKGFTLLIDRQSGRAIGTTYWESKQAMEASEEQVRPSRERAAEMGGATSAPQVSHYEVALDTEA